jgi:peptidoglycan hydrolase CwlO-like protein
LAGTGAGLAGIIVSGGVSSGAQKTTCATVSMLDTLVTGSPTDQWIGITPAVSKIEEVLQNFTNIVTSLSDIDTDFTDLNNKLNAAITDIQAMYDTHRNEVINDPDPAATTPTFQPKLIIDLGPTDQVKTVCGSMKEEMNVKSGIVKTASSSMDSAINSLKSQTSQIQSAIQSGLNVAKDIKKSVNDYLDSVGNFGDNVKD